MWKGVCFLTLFVCCALSQVIDHQLTMFNGNSCVDIGFGCNQCQGGYVTIYEYSLSTLDYSNSSSCNSGALKTAVQGSCSTSGYLPCTVFYTTSFRTSTLTVNSQSSVHFLFGFSPEPVSGHMTSTSAVLQGTINHVFLLSGDESIHFIEPVSSTQYATSKGVVNYGKQYHYGPITFTLDSSTSSNNPPPLPPIPKSGASANFYPFGGIFVYNNTREIKFSYNEFNMHLFASNEETGFYGVELHNPFLGVKNIQVFPPYEDNDEGTWVFQFAESLAGSGFHVLPAYYSESGNYRFYECGMGSLASFLSLSFSGSFSFSLDKEGNYFEKMPSIKTADSMAFELF